MSSDQATLLSALPEFVPGQRNLVYAGIGSRNTPLIIQQLMTRAAVRLEARGYILQTGDAKGADAAFAAGTQRLHCFTAADATPQTIEIAKALHPCPFALSVFALRLMARNTFQVFGRDLAVPVDFLLCWTVDGCESHATRTRATGGTGQAISLASLKNIPVINMANPGWGDRVAAILEGIS